MSKRGRPKREIDIERLRTLRAEGKSYGEIAKITGYSKTLVWVVLNRGKQSENGGGEQ